MLLGDIMNRLGDESVAAAALVELGDLVLIAEVDRMCQAHDETQGEYVSGAAQRFTNAASDEDWLQLMTALDKSDAPAATCLSRMVRWSIMRDLAALQPTPAQGCGCGSGGCGGHG
jgi:hypothetical protein